MPESSGIWVAMVIYGFLEVEAIYSRLAPVTLHVVSAPASQAFVERIFSMYGLVGSEKSDYDFS